MAGFDAEKHSDSDFTALPAGEYVVMATASELKPTKKNDGEYFAFTFKVMDGAYKGRLLFGRFMKRHPNETTVKIGQGQLASLCKAVNKLKPRDTLDLHGIPCVAVVRCKKNTETGDMENELKGFKPTSPGSVQTAAAPSQQAPWLAAKTTQSA
jgi:hypothetical protein